MYFDLYFSLSYLFSSYIIYFTFWGQIQYIYIYIYIYISIYSKIFLIFLWLEIALTCLPDNPLFGGRGNKSGKVLPHNK